MPQDLFALLVMFRLVYYTTSKEDYCRPLRQIIEEIRAPCAQFGLDPAPLDHMLQPYLTSPHLLPTIQYLREQLMAYCIKFGLAPTTPGSFFKVTKYKLTRLIKRTIAGEVTYTFENNMVPPEYYKYTVFYISLYTRIYKEFRYVKNHVD